MINAQLNEEIITPTFVGDDDEAVNALQFWTSMISSLTFLDETIKQPENKIAFLESLQQLIILKISSLRRSVYSKQSTASIPASDNQIEKSKPECSCNSENKEHNFKDENIVDLTVNDELDDGGNVKRFSSWFEIPEENLTEHAKTLSTKELKRISGFNVACLRDRAITENIIAKNELKNRSLETIESHLGSETKRMLKIAGI